MSTRQDILEELTSEGYMVYPDALDNIVQYKETDILIDKITNKCVSDTINEETVSDFVQEIDNKNETINPKEAFDSINIQETQSKSVEELVNRRETIGRRYPEIIDEIFNRDIPTSQDRIYTNSDYSIYGDISGNSRGQGEFDDFVSLFNDRYQKLIKILRNRVPSLYDITDINPRSHGGDEIVIGGLVASKFVSKNQNYFIDIETPDTNELVSVGWTDDSIKDLFESVVSDEVVAIRGNLDDSGDIIWGDSEVKKGRPPIMFPDIPRRTSSEPSTDKDIRCAMISDIHIGSKEFRPDKWNKFVDWVRGNPKVKYIFVAGDIVEGIGVYPGQKEELSVTDIKDQYALAAEMLSQIPEDTTIICSVGNHDTVRLAEPQPKLPDKFRQFFDSNVVFTGNPVTVELHGRSIMMYHGMSIYDVSESIPGLSPEDPIPVMEELLKKRHLSPIYGQNVRLSPEEQDYLVIDEIPDLLHSGHVHKYGEGSYQGVKIINTATWQDQTDFQKSKGISPDCGYWSVLNLSNMNIEKHYAD